MSGSATEELGRLFAEYKEKKVEFYYQTGNGYGNSLREAITNCNTKYFCISRSTKNYASNV